MDILYGRNPVLEALRSGRAARKLVIAAGIPREHRQGIAGYFHGRAPLAIADLLENSRPPQLFVVLDGIQDPQNLGAITRTADAVGADGIVLPQSF